MLFNFTVVYVVQTAVVDHDRMAGGLPFRVNALGLYTRKTFRFVGNRNERQDAATLTNTATASDMPNTEWSNSGR